jgi:hypothetical protein
MGHIRPFAESDIPQVVQLYQTVYQGGKTPPSEALNSFFHHVFFHNPWYDEDLPSLIYEGKTGKIIGFLGVFPRLMSMNGRLIKVAVSNNFMVEPGSRNTLAGLELLEMFFRGPQDLSIAEGGDLSRKLWEGLGGHTSLLHSIKWTRPLRPCRYIISLLTKDRGSRRFAFLSGPFCHVVDAVAARMSPNHFNRLPPRISGEELDVQTFLSCISEFADKQSLRPVYDERSLNWLLEVLAQKKMHENFRKIVVHNAENQISGWYVYYANPGGVSEVLQIGAKHDTIKEVLGHLFRHAWIQGVVALSGGIDPKFIQEFSDKLCLFNHGGSWLLIHSREVELIDKFHRGEVFFSRLEGEWMFFNLS